MHAPRFQRPGNRVCEGAGAVPRAVSMMCCPRHLKTRPHERTPRPLELRSHSAHTQHLGSHPAPSPQRTAHSAEKLHETRADVNNQNSRRARDAHRMHTPRPQRPLPPLCERVRVESGARARAGRTPTRGGMRRRKRKRAQGRPCARQTRTAVVPSVRVSGVRPYGGAAGVSRVARVVGVCRRWRTSAGAGDGRFDVGAGRERTVVSGVLDGAGWKLTCSRFSAMPKVLC